jgi:hypothetical protein
MRKDEGWTAGAYTWVKNAGRFELVVDPGIQNSAAVYVKPGGLVFHPLPDDH